MIILLGFAFLAGLVTILSPCIWPLIPIVLSVSFTSKGKQKPLGISLGIITSFSILTLFFSTIVRIFNIDPNILRIIAVIFIASLGVVMIVPSLSARFDLFISRFTNKIKTGKSKNEGFFNGFITGLALGVIWVPCAGPILATIIALTAVGKISLDIILITFFYAIGAAIPLFLIALGGQKIVQKSKKISKYTGKIQQIFGIIMILTAILIYTNYDQVLQNDLLNIFPILNNVTNGFETSGTVTHQLNILKGNSTRKSTSTSLFNQNYKAPDFIGITKWLNTTSPISIKSLKGNVVLVDFWTYTCINCIRTLPHITTWYNTYKKDGFVVIGIHTPEFQFEHDTSNVNAAIKQDGIAYPVGQDNNYSTWNNYNNQYWPAEYLIDANGNVRRTDFGEGSYSTMEEAIRTLITESGHKVSQGMTSIADKTPQEELSPETYLGSTRMQYFYPYGNISPTDTTFTLNDNIVQNSFSYGGEWNIMNEYAVAEANATLNYNFIANKVYIILRPPTSGNASVKVFLDGTTIPAKDAGSDVINGIVNVTSSKLYNIVNLGNATGNHVLKLEFDTIGTQAFTFTFG